jgi:hypothetical protein
LFKDLDEQPNFIDISGNLQGKAITCPQCRGRFHKARRIEPLDQLADSFKKSIIESQATSIKEPLPDTELIIQVSSDQASPPSRVLRGSSDSQNTARSGHSTDGSRHRRLPRIFSLGKSKEGPNSSQSTKAPRLPKSYCFSADGKTLILWNRGQDYIFATTIPEEASEASRESNLSWDWKRYTASKVRLVVAGGTRLAAVCHVSLILMFRVKV